jgi:putative sterol carrier protein
MTIEPQPSLEAIEAALARRADRLGDMDARVRLDMGDAGSLRIDGRQRPARIDRDPGEVDCTLQASVADFAAIAGGTLDAMTAVLTGRIKLQGSTAAAMKLGTALQ